MALWTPFCAPGNCEENLVWGWGLRRALPPLRRDRHREGDGEGHGFLQDDTK